MRGVSNTKRMGRPILDPTRFPCGHPRSRENSSERKYPDCKTCRREREKRRRRDRRGRPQAFTPPAPRGQTARRYITTPAIQRAIAEARVEFNRFYGLPDSTDPAQLSADFGGEG